MAKKYLFTLIVLSITVFASSFYWSVEDIPKTWDIKAIKRFHLPPPDSTVKVVYASEEYYNSLPDHVIYKTFPVYVREYEPKGYLDSLRKLKPEIAFDVRKLKTQAD